MADTNDKFSGLNTSLTSEDLSAAEVPEKFIGDVEVTYTSSAADKWAYNAKLKNNDGVFSIDGKLSNYTNKGSNTHIFANHVEASAYRTDAGDFAIKPFFDGRSSTGFGKVTTNGAFVYNGGASAANQGSISKPEYLKDDASNRTTEIEKIYKIGDYNVLGARGQ